VTLCQRCRQQPAVDGKHCNDCGADLYDEWRADRDVAEHDAAVAAGLIEDRGPNPDPDLPF
jgi:hypothetical protein